MARVRNLPKNRYSIYLTRARQHERQLSLALDHHRWEAAGLSAVHLVISSVDAVTCAKLGKVWSGEEHAGVVDLLRETGTRDLDPTIRQVAAVLEAKTRVEYGAEPASEPVTAVMAKQARRVFDWALETIGISEAGRR